MPNLDPWVNQNNNDYADMTTQTIQTNLKLIYYLLNLNTKNDSS